MNTQTHRALPATDAPNTGKTLSIYLNVDQSLAANLNHGFERPVRLKLRAMESEMESDAERDRFRRSAAAAVALLASYRPSAISVAVFVHADGHVTSRDLNVPMETAIRWQDRPYMQPLVEAADEFQEVLIVLLDGRRARLLTSFLGHVVEYPEIHNPYPTAHTQAPGHDRQKSQTTFHRKSDEREKHYLKVVADAAEKLSRSHGVRRIVLAGNNISSKELYEFLPKDIRACVISYKVLSAQAAVEEITEAIAIAQERAERLHESAKVQSLLDRAGKVDRAVTGVAATLDALKERRIHELVYADGMAPLAASVCDTCGALYSHPGICLVCGTDLRAIADAMDTVIGAALETGAAIEQVRGNAAEQLRPSGGIGAFLRF